MEENYLESIQKQFAYYKVLGERTFVQLADKELFWQYHPASNSIGIIVKHIWGNALSRWTDFLHSDGEKKWRDREAEFEADIKDRAELIEKWEEAWVCVFRALNELTPQNMDTIVYIRNVGHTVTEALNRQLAHYAYHIGQIVYIGRMCKGDQWQSLSIPRGETAAYNQKQFAKPKRRGHFTDEYLSDKDTSPTSD